jgi:hypothetical protein
MQGRKPLYLKDFRNQLGGRRDRAIYGSNHFANFLLPFDHRERVVVHHDDLDRRQPVLDGHGELGHEHGKASISDKGD